MFEKGTGKGGENRQSKLTEELVTSPLKVVLNVL